jgi:hypothetical protein
MLTQDQLSRLQQAIREDGSGANPLVRLIEATRRADLVLADVLEHIIVQTLQNPACPTSETQNPKGTAPT